MVDQLRRAGTSIGHVTSWATDWGPWRQVSQLAGAQRPVGITATVRPTPLDLRLRGFLGKVDAIGTIMPITATDKLCLTDAPVMARKRSRPSQPGNAIGIG